MQIWQIRLVLNYVESNKNCGGLLEVQISVGVSYKGKFKITLCQNSQKLLKEDNTEPLWPQHYV